MCVRDVTIYLLSLHRCHIFNLPFTLLTRVYNLLSNLLCTDSLFAGQQRTRCERPPQLAGVVVGSERQRRNTERGVLGGGARSFPQLHRYGIFRENCFMRGNLQELSRGKREDNDVIILYFSVSFEKEVVFCAVSEVLRCLL